MKTVIPKAYYDRAISEGADKERLDTNFIASGDLPLQKIKEHPFKLFK